MLVALIIANGSRVRLKRFWKKLDGDQLSEARLQEILKLVSSRKSEMSSIMDFEELIVIHRKFASLNFIALCLPPENEFAVLEFLQYFVEALAAQFESLAEIDIMFQLDKVYMLLDELVSNGSIVQTSKVGAIQAVSLIERGGPVVK
ncbi:hypothetical protein SmJEL517_g00488 [Synchytrium microbalum]|uniref:AP complex subunit sigma n=1 Tax=Synchytrium microbalum TaxID=1806994 RepID=A0A507CD50_9FUNG|nr:uncharacterized protein SmJEL517_g00488 [Synchytrium microbalum]TPX37542.1 hypothetical protein SmJEL517_g00488 [Synchytrium microbalum]